MQLENDRGGDRTHGLRIKSSSLGAHSAHNTGHGALQSDLRCAVSLLSAPSYDQFGPQSGPQLTAH